MWKTLKMGRLGHIARESTILDLMNGLMVLVLQRATVSTQVSQLHLDVVPHGMMRL